MDSFSRRHGLGRPDAEITIRNEAPPALRSAVIQIAYQCGLKPSDYTDNGIIAITATRLGW